MKKVLSIPFDPVTGDLQSWQEDVFIPDKVNGGYIRTPPIIRDNYEFDTELTFVQYGRGMSSITFEFVDDATDRKYSMFVSDFSLIVPKLVKGKLKGRFTFCKKGKNFGIKML